MNKTLLSRAALALAAAASLALPAAASAQEGPWLVRVRALNLDPANKDDIAGADASVNSKVFPEVDISYFFTPNIAAELILTYPQKHDVKVNGTQVGTLKHLPPTLTLQYHVTGFDGFKPYVGAGVNYTRFSSVDLGALSIDKSSTGLALQVGVDIPLQKNLSLNVDVKKVQIRTDVSAPTGKLGEFRVDPVLFGVGLGWRF